MVKWLYSCLAQERVWISNPGLDAMISETGYLLLPSRKMTEILLNPQNNPPKPIVFKK